MTITTKKFIQSFIIVPLVATTLSMNTFTTAIHEAVSTTTETVQPADLPPSLSPEEAAEQTLREQRAAKIDAYFTKYNMPLAGEGMRMVLSAEKHDLDWRLLPAIAVRESTGGKFACKNNPFGFGSCKIGYTSFDQAIDAVAGHIGGDNPRTKHYYDGKDTVGILKTYNSVIPTYTKEVLGIMNSIENIKV